MDRYSIEGSTLTGIADAIREKTGGSEEIKVEDMAGKIDEISGGGEIGTCTVNIDLSSVGTVDIKYYKLINNIPTLTNISTSSDRTLYDIVCCTAIIIKGVGYEIVMEECSSNMESILDVYDTEGYKYFGYTVPITNGDIGTITITD